MGKDGKFVLLLVVAIIGMTYIKKTSSYCLQSDGSWKPC